MTDPDSITIAELAEVNPPVVLRGLSDDVFVSFIPMADVTDSGQWGNRQERRLGDIRFGYTPFKEGDILFAKITPCMENGKGAHAVGLKNGVGFGSTEFHVLRARDSNNPRFLFHWLQSPSVRAGALAFMGGSAGQQRVQSDFFSHFRIVYFEGDEQARIAGVLDYVEEAITKTEAVIAKLRQVRAGLLHDLLTRGLDKNGEFRDPIAHPEQFRSTPVGLIPHEWRVEPCHSLCLEIVVGIVVRPAQYYVQEGIPVLRSANVRENGIDLSDLVFISRESNTLLSKSILRAGNVVTVRTGYPGTSCVIPPELDGANCVDLIISRPGPEILPEFLAFWINSSMGRGQVLRVQGGLAQQHFNVTELKALIVAKPEPDEQREIVRRLEAFDQNLKSESLFLAKMSLVKSGLMFDLLTGRVRVPENLELTK